MKLRKQELAEYAFSRGLDLFGVANIERFEGAPLAMHPASIFPEARSVIVVGKRIVRGGWRGIEEGTNWVSYTYHDYHGLLNSFYIPLPLYETACFMEDHGWEAIPYYPGGPEAQPPRESLRQGAAPPNVELAIRIAGAAAGVGEIGWAKVFLTARFGPRQRLAAIITDLELEPDPLVEPGAICDRCMRCVQGCAPGAIPHISESKTVKIQIEDTVYEWGDIDLGKCAMSYHGGDASMSPFIHKDFPGWNIDVREQGFSELAAYKFAWTLSTATRNPTREFPSGYIIEGHRQLQKWGVGGSYGVEGSRGCMRSCFDHLERRGRIEQTFEGGDFIKRPRWILPHKVERTP